MKKQFISKYGIDFDKVESYDSEDGEEILRKCKQLFESYEYRRDWDRTPVRVIRLKDGSTNYADYLNPKTASLFRRINTLSVDDRYIDDLTELEYYEACEFYISRKRFLEQVDDSNCVSKLTMNRFYLINEIPVRARFQKGGNYVMQFLQPNDCTLIEKMGATTEISADLLQTELSESQYYELGLSLMNKG